MENLNGQNSSHAIAQKTIGDDGPCQNFRDPSLADWHKDYHGTISARLRQGIHPA